MVQLPGFSEYEEGQGVTFGGNTYGWSKIQQFQKNQQAQGVNRAWGTYFQNPIPYYKTETGYSADKSKAVAPKAEISLNKDTGEIDISASSDFLGSDVYKNNYKPLLEGLSQTYRQNPDATFALDKEGGEWNGSEKTVEEWVEALNDKNSQRGIAKVDQSVRNTYDEIREQNKAMFTEEELAAGKGWTENDIVLKYQTVWEGGDVKHNSYDLQALPQTDEWKKYLWNLFSKAGVTGYDGESGMITKEGWEKWYNRDNTSDDEIMDLYTKLREEFHNAVDAKDPTRIARASALLSTMESSDAKISGIRAVGDWLAGVGVGILDIQRDWASAFYSFLLSPVKLRNAIVEGVTGLEVDDKLNDVLEYYEQLPDNMHDISDYMKERSKALGSQIGTGLAVGELLGEAGKIALSIKAGNVLSDLVGVAASGALKLALGKLSQGDQSSKFVAGLTNAVDLGLKLMDSKKFIQTANRALNEVSGASWLGGVGVSAITKTTELLAETIGECIISDPQLTLRFLAGTEDSEARQYVIENMAWNAGGWAAANVAMKALKGFSKTTPGKFLNRNITKSSMAIRTTLADLVDLVREKMPGRSTAQKLDNVIAAVEAAGEGASVKLRNKKAKLQLKNAVEVQNRALREAAKDVVASKGAKGFEKAYLAYMEVQNATDVLKAAQSYFFAEIRTNKTLATALGDVDDSVSEISKILEKEGKAIKTYAEAGEFGLKHSLAYMDQGTANYISAIIDNQYLQNYRKRYGTNSKLTRQLQANKKMINEFMKNASEELKLAADTAVTRIQNFWGKYNDWAINKGIYNKAQIESMRASKLWGKNGSQYAMLQRAKEPYVPYSQRQIAKTRNEMGNLKSRVMGSSDNYKDPILTIYNNLIGDAYDYAMKSYTDTLKQVPGIFKAENKLVDATETEFARKIRSSGQHAQKEVSKSVETVIGKNSFDYEAQFGRRAQAEIKKAVDVPNLRKQASKDAVKLNDISSRTTADIHNLHTTSAQRRTAVASLSNKQLNKVATPNQRAILETGNSILAAQDALSDLSSKTVSELDDVIDGLGYVGASEAFEAIQQNPAQFDAWLSTLSPSAQKQVKAAIREANGMQKTAKVTGDSFIEAMDGLGTSTAAAGEGIGHKINSIILGDAYTPSSKAYKQVVNELAETDAVKKIAAERVHQSQLAQAETVSKASQQRYNDALAGLRKEYNGAATYESIDKMIDDLVEESWSRPGVQEAFTAAEGGLMQGEDLGKNMVLTELGRTNNKKAFRSQVVEAFKKETKDTFREAFKGEKTASQIDDLVNKAANAYADMAEERLLSRAAEARNALQQAGSPFSNSADMFDEAKALTKKIEGYTGEVRRGTGSNVIRLLNENGATEFYEVSPAMASFFNMRPTRHIDTKKDRFLRALSSIFRFGTTGPLVINSFMNQWVKDSGNAWVAGNAFRSIQEAQGVIAEAFGENVAKAFGDWTPDELRILGLDNIADAQELAARELARGAALSPTSTEFGQYQFSKLQKVEALTDAGFKGLDNINDMKTWSQKAQGALEKGINKLDLGQYRESYLRNRVFSNAYAEAISSGHSIKDSRTIATFLMNNATTNFGRSLTHLENLRATVPYIGAAINGSKSFFRVAELDPVGVMTRILGGFVVPVVALTAQNLASEENRKVYQNIPEWQRASSFCFVVNGQVLTIPLPEQVADIVAPWRQFVEYLHGAQRGTFEELLLNDLVGFSPVDFSGFTSVDIDQIYNEPEEFWKHKLELGGARLLSQFSDPLTKSAIIWATGIDPYTGNYVDQTFYTQDDDGNVVAVDYNSGWLAQTVSGIMNGITGSESTMSAAMAQKIMQTLLGNANVEVIDGLTEMAGAVGNLISTGDFGSFLGEIGEGPVMSFIDEATSPFYAEVYDRALTDWRHAVAGLQREKEAILGDKKFQTILQKISTESDPEKLAVLKAQRQNYVDDFQTKVLNITKQLKDKYPSAVFDKYKFATVLNLMNMNANASGTNVYAETAFAQSLTKDQKKQGQMMAYNTMLEMGFPDVEGRELTGYIAKEFGEVKVVYANPLSILAYSTTKQMQKDIHLANIEALINEKDWYSKRQAVKQQINAIYNKDKLSRSDYNQIDAIRVAYNGDLMKDLAPYIKTYTPEMVLGSQDVMDLLSQWIQAPTGTLGYTKNKTDIKGNAQDAYIENYIKAIFKVNDSTYVGGKDYSGRGQWWKGE